MTKPRFKIIPAVHLVLRSGGKFLMLRRYQTGFMDGFYSVVAGHVDGNEFFRAAMAREAFEEAGISIEPDNLTLVHTMHSMDKEERLFLFFEADQWAGKITNMEPQKCDDLDWYTVAENAGKMVPYVAAALERITEGIDYSEFG
jgi:8-oxo-dGTP pyrophosphatase MutT (NUDIX family)